MRLRKRKVTDPWERLCLLMWEMEWSGTVFGPGDVEQTYEEARMMDDGWLPPFEEAWQELKSSWEWRKGIDELLTERGWDIINGMVDDYVRTKRKERDEQG